MTLQPDLAQSYWQYTGPYRRERDVNVLEGILLGVGFNGRVSKGEAALLEAWCQETHGLERVPFSDLHQGIEAALADGVLTDEEQQHLIGICRRYTEEHPRFDTTTQDMQRLHGVLGGIAADGEIERSEVDKLQDWLEEHDNLQGMWPYDEVDNLVVACGRDDEIAREQQAFMMNVCREFVFGAAAELIIENMEVVMQSGVCAACPKVVFQERIFCFTGNSSRGTRQELAAQVEARNGVHENAITQRLHYLVIAPEGNKAWAFRCYGRKVEKAMNMRKKGHRLVLVHENDFWDAVQDAG